MSRTQIWTLVLVAVVAVGGILAFNAVRQAPTELDGQTAPADPDITPPATTTPDAAPAN